MIAKAAEEFLFGVIIYRLVTLCLLHFISFTNIILQMTSVNPRCKKNCCVTNIAAPSRDKKMIVHSQSGVARSKLWNRRSDTAAYLFVKREPQHFWNVSSCMTKRLLSEIIRLWPVSRSTIVSVAPGLEKMCLLRPSWGRCSTWWWTLKASLKRR
jgi:hypothetical protein